MELFDSHAHLMDEKFGNEVTEIIRLAEENNVKYITNIGYNEETSNQAVREAEQNENVFATIGIHPEHCNCEKIDTAFIEKLVQSKKMVAIGEIGLDYHYEGTNRENQKKHFIEQIQLANAFRLPVVIHSRDADMDMLEILKQVKIEKGFVMHCFSSSVEVAKEILKLGGYISFSGTVTFKNARNLAEVVKLVPLEKILVETDAPYLAPEPKRGTRNEPSFVKFTAQKIADIKEMSLEKIAEITVENTKRFYGIQKEEIFLKALK